MSLGTLLGSSTVQIWKLGAGRECRTFRHDAAGKGPWSGGISPDGRLLASSGDNDVAVWDLASGRQIASLRNSGSRSAFFHPTAPYLITSGRAGLQRWPIRARERGRVEIGSSDPLTPAGMFERSAISRDGSTLAVGEVDSVRVFHSGPHAGPKRIQAQRATSLFLVEAYANVRFSPNGQWLATVTGAVSQLWRVGSWQPGRSLRRDDPEIAPGSAAFTADGAVVALEQSRRLVKLIEVATGRELAQLEAADVPLCTPLCFSRDGRLLATRGGPGLLQVWDLRAIRQGLKAMGLDWAR